MEYVQTLFVVLKHLRNQAHLDTATETKTPSSPATPHARPSPASSSTASQPSASTATATTTTTTMAYDWAMLQAALRVLELTTKLASNLTKYETTLRTTLADQKAVLFGKDYNPVTKYGSGDGEMQTILYAGTSAACA